MRQTFLLVLLLLAFLGARAQAPTWQGIYTTNPVQGSNGQGNVVCQVQATAMNAAGDLLIVGTYTGTVNFPKVGGGNIQLTTANEYSTMYVGKWNTTSKAWVWAVGTPSASGLDIAVNGNDVYVSGSYGGGSATIAGTTLTNDNTINDSDGFLAKYIDNGASYSNGWALKFGGSIVPSTDAGEKIAVSGNNLYLGGRIYGTSTLAGTTMTSAGQSDIFLAKFDLSTSPATPKWALSGGGARADVVNAVTVNGSSVYFGGNFASTLTLGSQTLTTTALGDRDIFLAKITDNGNTYSNVWAIRAGGTSSESLLGMQSVGTDLYFTGLYANGASGSAIGGTTLTTTGSTQMYVAKYTDAGTSVTPRWAMGTTNATAGSFSQGNELAINGTSVFVTGTSGATSTIAGTTMTAAGLGGDVYVARFTDNGNTVSGNGLAYGGSSIDSDSGLDLEMRGSTLYVGGYARQGATFGGQTINSTGISTLALIGVLTATNLPAAPTISGINPNTGPVGTSVTVTGTNLSGATAARVNGTAGTITANTATSLTFTVGAGSTTGAVSVSTGGGTATGATFTVTVANSAPTDLQLSNSTIAENAGANATVGTLSTTDPNSGNTFTYSLVTGNGSNDNGSFNISGNTLRLTASANYEAKNSYSVRIRTTDQGGLSYEEAFTITVTNVNEAPTDVTLSNNSVAENQPANTTVGTLSTTDPDAGNTFGYSLVSGNGSADNTSFNISGNTLRTSASFDFETKSTYSIRVRTTDQGGLTYDEAFTINVTNVDDTAPTVVISSTASNPTSVSPIQVAVTFSESVTGFAAGDVSVTNGSLNTGSFAGSGASYSFTVTPTATGLVTVNVPANAAQDGAGNGNTAATQFSIQYNAPSATVTSITRLTPSPTATSQVSFSVTFSANVTGVTASKFSVATTGLTGASVASVTSVSGSVYTVVVNTGSGNGTLRLNLTDASGITPTISNAPYTSGPDYTITKTFTNPVLAIQGMGGSANDDVTAYVDEVQLLQGGTAVSGALLNPGFETFNPLTSGNGDYGYNPTGASWTFLNNSGIAKPGNGFNPPTPLPGGAALAFVQSTSTTNGRIEQNLAASNGTFQIRFQAGQRACCSSNDQRLNVYINNVFVGAILPTGSGYTSFTSSDFTVIAPVIASFAPNPAGANVPVTLTGSNLSGATSLSINGAAATILSNSGTALTFKVPAGATATGTSSVTTPNGTTSSTTFTFLPPPGNALIFDGNDEVTSPTAPTFGTGDFTIEAWVRTATTGTYVAVGSVGGNDYWLGITNQHAAISVSGGTPCEGTSRINDNQWHHLAGVRSGGILTIYVDGIAQNTNSNTRAANPNAPLGIGSFGNGSYQWLGRLDEVRLWSVARTPAQLLAAMTTPLTGSETSLVRYFSFDEGQPGGTNTGLTTLYDLTSNAKHGTLSGFVLAGTTSNWVESYALVVPTATAATAINTTGFTANWTAPSTGTVEGYSLEVSTLPTFAPTFVYPQPAGATSSVITGLTPGRQYYVRVRAEKASVTGQGSFSNVVTVTTACSNPVAIARNVSVNLVSGGTATVTTAQVNNNSTANCGTASNLQLQKQGVLYNQVSEGNTLTLTAPAGAVFTSIDFASYGNASGTNGNYVQGSCHSSNSMNVVSLALLGKNTGSIVANNTTFTDPCGGTPKTLAVRATYTFTGSTTQLTYTCTELGANKVLLTVTDATGTTSTVSATVTVAVPTTATSVTWTGGSSAQWTECGNWSFGKVPDASTSVVIPAGLGRYPNLSSGTLTMKDLTIEAGATLMTSNGALLEVYGNWTNNGTATLGGPVAFRGTTAQTLGGSGAATFSSLTVNKTGTLTLLRAATVTGTLTMSSGLLATDTYDLTTTGATLSESESSYVLGRVVSVANVASAGTRYAFGNLGLALTPANGSTAFPGSTTVRRVTGTALSGTGSSTSIKRYYDIQSTINAGLNVTLELGYLDTERNSIAENQLTLFRSTTGTAGPWQPVVANSRDAAANTVTATGVQHFSVWTLGSSANPLPVELSAFSATLSGSAVKLRWTTASEKNNVGFTVERSLDGRAYTSLGFVAGTGSSTTSAAYSFLDSQLPTDAALLYYRLRQLDQDGSTSYSPVETVSLPMQKPGFVVYPTVAEHHAVTYRYTGPAATGATIEVLNAVGQVVGVHAAGGQAQGSVPLSGLPSGTYLLRFRSAAGSFVSRCVVP